MNEEKTTVEWHETLDGIINKLKELKEENDRLVEENKMLKAIKPCSCKPKQKTKKVN